MNRADADIWPELPYRAWQDTCTTLHMWMQVVGKVRLARTPWLNHSWHATLYVTARGLTTSPIPHGRRSVQIDFDFLDHALIISTSDGGQRRKGLEPCAVADFYAAVTGALVELGVPVDINARPSEVPDPIRFDQDRVHASYDAEYAQRFWRALVHVDRVLKQFRTGFLGKVSPVHLFWGALDLAVTRFSGRTAPPHPGGIPNLPDAITREAYSHEVSSAGFWPGGGPVDQAMFYSYAYPAPAAFRDCAVEPSEAYYHEQLGEFVLPYDAVRSAAAPEKMLLSFLDSTYRAAADTGRWDRGALECDIGQPGVVRKH
jgi:Family of unknown function (DUF5996)